MLFHTLGKALGICATTLLLGCEASLNLDSVNQQRAKSYLRTDQFQEMVMINNDIIVLVGSQGLVLSSNDQGQNWQRLIVTGKPNFIGLSVCPDSTLIALSFDRRLWLSDDNGKQWSYLPIDTREDIMDISCAPDGSYWVTASFSTLLHSRDRGHSWQSQTFGEDALLTHIEFFDDNIGIVAGEFGLFYKTQDGGNSWQSIGVIGDELYPLAIHFSDPNTGWAAGLNGVIMHTRDGGASWSSQETETQSPIYHFIPSGNNLYATGDHGSILMLKEARWMRLQSPDIPVYLSTGLAFDNQQLLVAGGWGTLFSVTTK